MLPSALQWQCEKCTWKALRETSGRRAKRAEEDRQAKELVALLIFSLVNTREEKVSAARTKGRPSGAGGDQKGS